MNRQLGVYRKAKYHARLVVAIFGHPHMVVGRTFTIGAQKTSRRCFSQRHLMIIASFPGSRLSRVSFL
jgi:hypothetical protein